MTCPVLVAKMTLRLHGRIGALNVLVIHLNAGFDDQA